MKKLLVLAALFWLAGMVGAAIEAGPAPKLSKVTIIGIGPDANGNWLNPANHNIAGNVYGNTLNICVEYIGSPNWNLVFFYQNGSLIKNDKLENYATTYITDGGIITGYIKAYSVPMAFLPGNKTEYLGQFAVKARENNGNRVLGDYINNVYRNKS